MEWVYGFWVFARINFCLILDLFIYLFFFMAQGIYFSGLVLGDFLWVWLMGDFRVCSLHSNINEDFSMTFYGCWLLILAG